MAAILVGVAWLASTLLDWGAPPIREAYLVGLALFVLCLAAFGYSLVATGPIWLRAVVALATPALGAMVWLSVIETLSTDHVAVLGAGIVLLVTGAIGLARSRRGRSRPGHARPVHGRRAAR